MVCDWERGMSVADPILCPNEFWDPVLKNEDENSVVIFEENDGLRLLRSTDADGLELDCGDSVAPTCC